MKRRTIWQIKQWIACIEKAREQFPVSENGEHISLWNLRLLQQEMQEFAHAATLERLNKGARSEKG